MRDEKRIPVMLKSIEEIWIDNPELRLMQLLINIINPKEQAAQLYYLEDDALLNALRNWKVDN